MKPAAADSQAVFDVPVFDRTQVVYDVLGFDRTQFVSDVLAAASVPAQTHIARVVFDADGIRSTGWLAVQVADPHHLHQIDLRLQQVRGLIRVTQRPTCPTI